MTKEMITLTIDGKEIKAYEGETILNIARANGIFIPAICYLTRCSPTLACRVCLVEADGKRAYACNAKAKDGMNVVVHNDEIHEEREAIMQVYDINHPLQCGVCDKSGECELQDNTMFMQVDSQNYCIQDSARPVLDWGKIKYDAGLCIVCERCVTACKDMIGDAALKTVPRGGEAIAAEFKESMPKDAYTIWNKMNKSLIGTASGDENNLDCIECGECISACPVGALVSSDFQYTSNAWELTTIPSTCAHCSSACHIMYDVKHTSVDNPEGKIYRVKNDFHFQALCGAGRFGYDYQNDADKDPAQFDEALKAMEKADTIAFDSMISNEEALMLQKLKSLRGYKLINPEAKRFQSFLGAFNATAGNYGSATLASLGESNFIVTLGSLISSDNPVVRFGINNAMKMNKGAGLYFHPVKDTVLEGFSKSMVSLVNKPGSEEAVMYLILDLFADKEKLPAATRDYLASFHSEDTITVKETVKEKQLQKVMEKQTNESGEEIEVEVEKEVMVPVEKEVQKVIDKNALFAMAGIDAIDAEEMEKLLAKKDSFTLILGEDVINHPRSENIAKLAGLMERYSDFKVMIVPPKTNSLGVALICDLDDTAGNYTVGYNVTGDFTLTALGAKGENELDMPALNQQEGTITSIDKRVVPLNAAIQYNGYSLGDLAKALGLELNYTVELTKELPESKGFKAISFDSLENSFSRSGENQRGYMLESQEVTTEESVETIADIGEYNGTVVYRCNPVLQFSSFTNKASQLNENAALMATESFLGANALEEGSQVSLELAGVSVTLPVVKTSKFEGNFAFVPTFEQNQQLFSDEAYRFAVVNLKKV